MKRMFGQPCFFDLVWWVFTGKMITVDADQWFRELDSEKKAETETDPFAF